MEVKFVSATHFNTEYAEFAEKIENKISRLGFSADPASSAVNMI